MTNTPFSPSIEIESHNGLVNFPVYHMRGGTSTGLVIWEAFAPQSLPLREELLRHLMGVPLTGTVEKNNQTTGLGRMVPTSNKVFFVHLELAKNDKPRIVSTFAQLAANSANIDWGVNCGNMTSTLPLWAFHEGILNQDEVNPEIDILNTNTGVLTTARLDYTPNEGLGTIEIPGVHGEFPGVNMFLHDPAGAKTGQLLPTGHCREIIEGIQVSCVDVAVPMVILKAADVGKTGLEPIDELSNDVVLMKTLQDIWIAAGLRMGLKKSTGELMDRDELARSETIPKVCLVAPPERDGSHITARYFTPQKGHASMAVTGGCCLAAACLIEGSIANEVAQHIHPLGMARTESPVLIDNPAGTLGTIIVGRASPKGIIIDSAAYNRSAQMLLKGWVPLYHASSELVDSLGG